MVGAVGPVVESGCSDEEPEIVGGRDSASGYGEIVHQDRAWIGPAGGWSCDSECEAVGSF